MPVSPIPLSDCLPGEWYLVFTCHNCKNKHPLFQDLSEGKSIIRGSYSVECLDCHYEGTYDIDEIERYQHPSNNTSID